MSIKIGTAFANTQQVSKRKNNPVNAQEGEAEKKSNKVDLKQAVKDYYDEYLTGLTDDERAEIELRIQIYKENNEIATKADADALLAYIKQLLMEFGYKGDINKYSEHYVADIEGSADINGNSAETAEDRISEINSADCDVISEEDGSKYLMISTKDGVRFKIKISDGKDSVNKDRQDIEKNWKKPL